jgi:hypothetical protein
VSSEKPVGERSPAGNLKKKTLAHERGPEREKENSLNLQPIIRAAVCAALVVVCLAGAGWFGTPSVSGQDQQIFRPGLRNSFLGHQLSASELNLVLEHLRRKTGFTRMRFDEAGFLTIDDRSQIAGGSAAARELLLAAVDGKKSINLQSHNRSAKVIFAGVGEGVKYINWRPEAQILTAPIEIDFADFNHLHGPRKAMEAFDLGFVILHELCHAALGLRDYSADVNAEGDCESYVNRIRRELGMPERRQYAANVYRRTVSTSGMTAKTAELIFTQTEPGREPESRAKTKNLYLRWDTAQVGNIRSLSAPPAAKEKKGAVAEAR